jgi:hypothetical protein
MVDIKKMHELEIEIKLHINQRLYDKGLITENMYIQAKDYILAE